MDDRLEIAEILALIKLTLKLLDVRITGIEDRLGKLEQPLDLGK